MNLLSSPCERERGHLVVFESTTHSTELTCTLLVALCIQSIRIRICLEDSHGILHDFRIACVMTSLHHV